MIEGISREEALALLKPERREELYARAHEVTERCVEKRFDFCSIINARSGRCSENCKWCAQSAHWKTDCETYGWVGTEACVKAAQEAAANGADRIGIVTSGRCLSHEDVENVCAALRAMRTAVPEICLCASLGLLSEDDLAKLKAAGLQRVHCNLETAPSLFPSLCSTHTTADKLATIHAAKRLGFQICCGGIIGMGETDEQLVEFAFALKEIAPDSIPVNVLHPIEGSIDSTSFRWRATRHERRDGGEVHLRGDVRRHCGPPSHDPRRGFRRRSFSCRPRRLFRRSEMNALTLLFTYSSTRTLSTFQHL